MSKQRRQVALLPRSVGALALGLALAFLCLDDSAQAVSSKPAHSIGDPSGEMDAGNLDSSYGRPRIQMMGSDVAVFVSTAIVTARQSPVASVVVSETTLTVDEGETAVYTVKLNAPPTGDVVLSLTISGSSDVSVSAGELTFTTDNWDTAQTVRVAAVHDADAAGDAATVAHAVVPGRSADEYDDAAAVSVSVDVDDDETASVVVSAASVAVNEGETAVYTVKLNAPPTGDVVLSLTISGSSDVNLTPKEMTFAPDNWDTPKTVRMWARHDSDRMDDAAAVTHEVIPGRSADEYDDAAAVSVSVEVDDDDDDPSVSVSAASLAVAEGATAVYTVVLDAPPTSDVVISVSSNNDDVTVTPAALTFTTSDWDTAQTVRVAAAHDADAANDAASIAHMVAAAGSADEYDAVTIGSVAVTVTDDDASVVVSETTLTVDEGETAVYTVKLNAPPTSDVVLSLTISGSSDVSVSAGELTFTTDNWDTAQTVRVAAVHDADAAGDAATVAHAVVPGRSADEYDDAAAVSVSVDVDDDETASVVVSAASVAVNEGETAVYTVKLNAPPTGDVVLSLTISGSSDVNLTPKEMTFAPDNWDTPKTVRMWARHDSDREDDAAAVTHEVIPGRSADEYDDAAAVSVSVEVDDDDDDPSVSVSAASLAVAEGATAVYTVVLDAPPTSDVVISVSSNNDDVTVTPAALTFTTSDWDTAQTVRVAAAHDADAANDAASIAHMVAAAGSADEYDAVTIGSVAVTVTDDDASVVVSETTLTVDEGETAVYTVKLNAPPTSDVVLSLTISGSSDVSVSAGELTFTTDNWDTAQTVRVAAVHDADAAGDAATVAHAVVPGRSADEYDDAAAVSVSVDVDDDETASVVVSAASVAVNEGETAVYTVKLNAPPTGDVVLSLTISGSSDVNLTPKEMTFAPDNWDTPKTVRMWARHDSDRMDDAAAVTHEVIPGRSADEYDDAAAVSVSVEVDDDDDDPSVSVSAASLAVAEGATAVYTVVLDAPPTSDVVISVSSNNDDVTVTPAALTFTTSDWDTAQTVRVAAAHDADAANDAASIAHMVAAAGSADEYDAVTIGSVAVTVTDDDASVVVSETTLTVDEGETAVYTVKLNAPPTSDVVLSLTISGSSDVSVSAGELTFTTDNWDTAQTVRVAAVHDADAAGDAATVAHAVVPGRSADEYDDAAAVSVSVDVDDDETASVVVSAASVAVNEGETAVYTVKLNAPPTGDVVLSLTISGSSDVNLTPKEMTFAPDNWDTPKTVRMWARHDSDRMDDAAAVTHEVIPGRSADEYDDAAAVSVSVTVTDDDTAAVTVSETTLTVDEGANGTYTVKLNAPPTSDVVINTTTTGSSDVTLTPATLTFTTSDWDTAQTVTVAAAQDTDAANDAASIAHTVAAAGSADEYDTVTIGSVAVTVTDDDTAAVTVSETTLTVDEGANGTYTVKLNAPPTSDVVINTTTTGSSDVTLTPATLTFTTSDWDTAQTVTVAAAQDTDAANDAASIAHTVAAAGSADEYDAVTIGSVAVTVTDDDASVVVSETTLTVDEGANGTYTVKLNAPPTSDVVINATTTGSSDVTLTPATLTFTTSDWDTAQTVTVTAAQDTDAANDAASIAHTVAAAGSADEYDAVTIGSVAVTVTDDDASVVVSETTLTVDEGANGTYTVKLNAPPTSDVVINATTTGSSDVTLTPTTLTFTTSDWDTAQTVTVTAAQDTDAANDAASIAHTVAAAGSADEYDAVTIGSVAVTVTDDDASVVVSETTLTVDEGANGTYTVKLNAPPTSDVVINATTTGSSDVTLTPTTLTFTTSDWDTAQTVTVTAAQDTDAANDAASIAHTVAAAGSADEYDAVTIGSVAVTVTDDDTAAVTVSETTLTVDEGANGTYTVKLNAPPTSDVVINTTTTGSSDVTLTPATLTFTTSDWDTAQTVTVAAAQDTDAANDAASIAHTVAAAGSADEYDAVTIGSVAVTVTDDDTAAVTVSETTLTVDEGANGTYTVKLNAPPTSDVVINTTTTGSSDVTLTPATLTFTTSDWDTAQTVTVAAAQDTDAANDAASIAHTVAAAGSADEYDAVTIGSVAVTVTDDDTAAVTVSETTLTVDEGANGTYTVKLNAPPTSDVVINATTTGSSDVTLTPATLTFTTSDWDTAQTVTVTAAQDTDAANDAASIAHTVAAAGSADEYDAVTIGSVAVTVTDDDTAAVTVSETTLTVDEGANGTYTVKLNAPPTSDVVINATTTGSSDVTLTPTTLTFTTSDWDTAQTVTVAAAQDTDAANDTASIAHTVAAAGSADEYDAVTIGSVAVTVTDDDTAAVTVSETTLTVDEGETAVYTVKLNAPPTSDVVLSLTVSGSSDVSVSAGELTFTTDNWDTAQTVTVAAAQDTDAANDAASIAHMVLAAGSADEYDAVTIGSVAVTVTDDDASVTGLPRGGGGSSGRGSGGDTASVRVSAASLTVDEGSSGTYTVTLSAPPTGHVVVSLTVNGSSDVSAPTGEMTFTTDNWNTPQTVRVTAAHDDDTANDTATLTHKVLTDRSADEYDAVTIGSVAVTVTDDDTAAVTVSETTLTVDEGANGTYTVKLNAQPTSDVVINATTTGSSDVTLTPATLTFTTSNWDTAQTMRVAAAQDTDAANDAASIAHTVVAASSADEYDAVTIGSVAVTVTDDDASGTGLPRGGGGSSGRGSGGRGSGGDTASVRVSAASLTVNEGETAVYTVKLNAQPTSDVVINATTTGSSDVTLTPATLTFTTSNWDTAQTVTVAAAQDTDAANDAATLTHKVLTDRSAGEYDTVTIGSVAVTVTDDDTAAVTVSETTLTVNEGETAVYTVKLNAQPTSDVVINATTTGSSDVTLTPAALTFTTSNWDTAQTVTVAAAQDTDAANDAATLTHKVLTDRSAGEYDTVTIGSVAVTVTDDDTAAVTVSETTLTVNEGETAVYTVKLNAQPTSDVVINATTTGSSDVTLTPATLTFTTSNWDTAQTVTVAAAQDTDAANDAATLTHKVLTDRSAGEYDTVTIGSVAVTVTDDDTAAVTVSETTLTVNEGETAVYTVKLNAQPTSDVVINATTTGSSDVTLTPAALTFTTSNWDTAQTVTVAAAQDTDAANDAATLTHKVLTDRSAGEYDTVTIGSVAVTVTDDDTAAVTVSETTLTVNEGETAVYTVKLNAQPTSDVVINATTTGSSDVTLTPAALTFTTSNWDTAQTVTVAAAQDTDAANDAATLTHKVLTDRSAGEYDTVTIGSVAVTVTDDDTAAVTVSETTLTVDEGDNGTYDAVTIGSVAVTVTDDDASGTGLPRGGGGSGGDTASVRVSAASLTVDEGSSGTYTVTLSAPPTGHVVVSLTVNGSSDVSAPTGEMTFTTDNWNTPQTVRVTAAHDDDTANDTATLTHKVLTDRSADEYDAVTIGSVAVTVTDDDTAEISRVADEGPADVAAAVARTPTSTSTTGPIETPVPAATPEAAVTVVAPTTTEPLSPGVVEHGGGVSAWVWALLSVLLILVALVAAVVLLRRLHLRRRADRPRFTDQVNER